MNKNLSENPKCPKCGAERAVKNGKVQGNQRFKCKNCNYQFTKMVLPGQPVEKKLEAVKLYCNGLQGNRMNVTPRLGFAKPRGDALIAQNV